MVSAPSVKKTLLSPSELHWDLCQKSVDSIYRLSFKFWAMLGPLHFYINFRVSLSVSAEKTWWDFGRYCFESIDQFGKNFHLNVESSNP